MLARIWSAALKGIEGLLVEIEVDLARKMPRFIIVGLPDEAVRESRDRVKTAMSNAGYIFPYQRTVINLAPANVKKHGAIYDLPIALGLLAASGQLQSNLLAKIAVVGELALDGRVRPVHGVLSMARLMATSGFEGFVVPYANAAEAAAAEGIKIYAVKTLAQAVALFAGQPHAPYQLDKNKLEPESAEMDYAEVKGQEHAKRVLLIAAAGGHNILLIGPPGSGKTMLARRLPTILPPLELEEALETTCIHSVANLSTGHQLIRQRPFRAPHHSISDAGLAGGGSQPRPGEISLAHNGVLFLDELPEFRPRVLEVLREPLETGKITLTRARASVTFPARIMLVAAMNPCPCGYLGQEGACTCSAYAVRRYRARVSGPLLDRIDIHLALGAVDHQKLLQENKGLDSRSMRLLVMAARRRQLERLAAHGYLTNAQMTPGLIERYCRLSPRIQTLLMQAMQRLSLSARAYHKILKLARTIADVANHDEIDMDDVSEAISYRHFDRVSLLA